MKKQRDVDGGWAWLVAFGVFLSFLFLGGFSRSFGILYAAFLDMFGQSASATSLIPAVRTACPIIIGPISTTLSERYTERKVVIAGSLLIVAGFVLSFFASSLNYLIISLGLIPGIGMALLISPSNVAMGKYFRRLRSRVYSLTSCGVCLGLVTVPLLFAYLMDIYSIRGSLLIFGGICLNLLCTGQVMRPIAVSSDSLQESDQELRKTVDHMDGNSATEGKSIEDNWDDVTDVECTHISSSDSKKDTPQNVNPKDEKSGKCSNNDNKKRVEPVSGALEIESTTEQKCEYISLSSEINPNTDNTTIKSGCDNTLEFSRSTTKRSQRRQCSGIILIVKALLIDLFDMTLMKNYVYLIFLCSCSLSEITYANQSIYLVPLIESRGISRDKAAIILSIMGGCDVIGRLLSGFLADKRLVLPHHVMCVSGIIAGISCCFFPLAQTFAHFAAVSVIFALVASAPTLLIMPALAESVGVASLARGLGLGMFFRGIFTAISLPLCGLVKDVTGSYDVIFPIIGCIQIVAGVVLLLEPIAKRLMKQRLTNEVKPEYQSE